MVACIPRFWRSPRGIGPQHGRVELPPVERRALRPRRQQQRLTTGGVVIFHAAQYISFVILQQEYAYKTWWRSNDLPTRGWQRQRGVGVVAQVQRQVRGCA